MKTKPCPFCLNPNASEEDTGEACCFCDYTGEVTIGTHGMFDDIEQYNRVFFATNHKDRLDELHDRNTPKGLFEQVREAGSNWLGNNPLPSEMERDAFFRMIRIKEINRITTLVYIPERMIKVLDPRRIHAIV